MSLVYVGEEFVEEKEAKISVFDRGFQFGDGAFATIQVNDGTPLFLETHLEQLARQCLSFQLHMPPINPYLIDELITLNQAEQGIWRLKIFVTGGSCLEMRLPQRRGDIIMILKPFTPHPFKALKLGIFPIPYSSCHASFKSLAHLNRYYVMEEAHTRGWDDCVTVTETGLLLEAAFGNLLFFHERTALTPDSSLSLYSGVTLKNALFIAKNMGFEIQSFKMRVEELPKEVVAFRTNTMQGIRPIGQIGAISFSRNTHLENLLIGGYEKLIEEQKKQRMESMRC